MIALSLLQSSVAILNIVLAYKLTAIVDWTHHIRLSTAEGTLDWLYYFGTSTLAGLLNIT